MRNREHDPYRHLLMLRFVLLNLAAFALLGVAYVHGFVDMVVAADRTDDIVLVRQNEIRHAGKSGLHEGRNDDVVDEGLLIDDNPLDIPLAIPPNIA